jgi:hypothetical protein
MAKNILVDLVSRLPDVYNKDAASNITKFIHVVAAKELQELENASCDVERAKDVDWSFGHNLDKIGENLNQKRGALGDALYRILLKTRIARNLSQGDINSLIRTIAAAMQANFEAVRIKEGWNSDLLEPAAIDINVDYAALGASGMSYDQFGAWINSMVAAGVRANVMYKGTFAFSSQAGVPETSDTQGFNAGTLGAFYDPGSSATLPL